MNLLSRIFMGTLTVRTKDIHDAELDAVGPLVGEKTGSQTLLGVV